MIVRSENAAFRKKKATRKKATKNTATAKNAKIDAEETTG